MKILLLLFTLLPLAGPAHAQIRDSLIIVFLSEPGVRPAGLLSERFTSGDARSWDAHGDGTVDLILQRDDDQGHLKDLRVLDGRTQEVIWEVQDVAATLGITSNMDFWGFVDPIVTAPPHALFLTDADAFLVDPRDTSIAWSWGATGSSSLRFLGAPDVTGDGLPNLVFYLADTKQVQVWGPSR